MTSKRRQAIHDAAKTLGAEIVSRLDKAIMDAAIDETYLDDPEQSEAMNSALSTVVDAKQTLASAREACEVIKRGEKQI